MSTLSLLVKPAHLRKKTIETFRIRKESFDRLGAAVIQNSTRAVSELFRSHDCNQKHQKKPFSFSKSNYFRFSADRDLATRCVEGSAQSAEGPKPCFFGAILKSSQHELRRSLQPSHRAKEGRTAEPETKTTDSDAGKRQSLHANQLFFLKKKIFFEKI